jgi:phosphoserine phosphatase RsbU/P
MHGRERSAAQNHLKTNPGGPGLRTMASPELTEHDVDGTIPRPGASHWRQLRADVERAARLQRSLLPDVSMPIGPFRLTSFYRPCEALGGDLFDLTWRQDCALLLVSDVMGHGVEAALIAMVVKAAFQETAEDTGEPGELLARMSARLRRISPESMFVAAAAVRLEPNGSDLQIASAGLPHPFVLRGSARRVDEIPLDGRPLGLLDGDGRGQHGACRLSLAPGDVLLIASDGIGSVQSARGEWFEDGRLRQVLAGLTGQGGRSVIDHVVAEAVAFGQGGPLPDDVNMVAVSCDGARTQVSR